LESNALLFIMLFTAGLASNGKSVQKSADAFARYTGANDGINKTLNDMSKLVPNDEKFFLVGGAFVGQTIVDRKIVFTWRFP